MTVSIGGVFLSSFCTGYYSFVFCYAVMFGLGGGFMYTAPLIVSWSRYPHIRGRVTGITMAAYGFTSMFFNLIATALVNPDNKPTTIKDISGQVTNHYFDEEVASRTPFMIRSLAGIYLLLGALGIICMGNASEKPSEAASQDQITLDQGFRSATFWKLCAASYLSSSFSMYVAAAFKSFGSERVESDYFLATVGAVSAFVNGASRIVWAEMVDHLGPKSTYLLLLGTQLFTSATIYYFAHSNALYMIYICLCFLNQGGHFVIFPTICAKLYGKNTGASLYAVLFAGFGLSSVTGFVVQKLFIKDIGYQYMFWILTVVAVASLGIALTIDEKTPIHEKPPLKEPLIAGSVFIWGNVSIYITSYLRLFDKTITLEDTFIVFPIIVVAKLPVTYIGTRACIRYGTRTYSLYRVFVVSLFITVLGVYASSYCTTFPAFLFWYGFVFGLGIGSIFSAPLIVAWTHYPNSQGRVTGIVMSAHGLAASIFNPLATAMINPDNERPIIPYREGNITRYYFGEEVAMRVPMMLRWLAAIYLVLAVIIIVTTGNITQTKKESQNEITVGEAVSTSAFWKLLVCCFLSMAYCMYLAPAFKDFGMLHFHDDHYLAIVGGLAAIFNGGSRFVWAELIEKIGFKKTYLIIVLIEVVTSSTIFYMTTSSKSIYTAYVLLTFSSTGGHFVVFPFACGKLFGKGTGASVYAIVFSSVGFASFSGFLIQYLWIAKIGYEYIFMILAVANVVCFGIALTMEETLPEKAKEELKESLT